MEPVLAGGCGLPMETCGEEDMSGTDPGAGPSGSSSLEDTEMVDGRRWYWFRALPTNRELLDWISEARDFASDC